MNARPTEPSVSKDCRFSTLPLQEGTKATWWPRRRKSPHALPPMVSAPYSSCRQPKVWWPTPYARFSEADTVVRLGWT